MDARAYTCMASEILERGEGERFYYYYIIYLFFFFLRESRAFHCAAMCVGAYMSMCTHGSPASVCGVLAWLFENSPLM